MLSDVLGSVAVPVLDLARKASVWKVNETRGKFLKTVTSTEM